MMKRRQFVEHMATAAAIAALPASTLIAGPTGSVYAGGYGGDYKSTVQWTRVGDVVYCSVILKLAPGQDIASLLHE